MRRLCQCTQVRHEAVIPAERMNAIPARPEIADDLPRVIHVVGNAVRPQVEHEVILAIAVTVAEPAVGSAVGVRVLGREQKGVTGTVSGAGGSNDLPDVVDAVGGAVASAQG